MHCLKRAVQESVVRQRRLVWTSSLPSARLAKRRPSAGAVSSPPPSIPRVRWPPCRSAMFGTTTAAAGGILEGEIVRERSSRETKPLPLLQQQFQEEESRLQALLSVRLQAYEELTTQSSSKATRSQTETALEDLRQVYVDLQYWDEALRCEERLETLWETSAEASDDDMEKDTISLHTDRKQAQSWYRRGRLHMHMASPVDASKCYQRALQIYDEQLYPEMFHADKGHVHMSLAGVAYARGSYEEALSMLQTEAEPQFRKHEQAMSVTASDETAPALPHPDWFQCLQHQGLVSRGMDEFSQALEFYEKARVALRNLGTHQLSTEEGRIQRQSVELDLADMHLVLDHFEEALSLYRSIWEADRIARRGEDGDVPVTALDGLMLHNIGRILVQQGRNDEAVKTLRDAADLKKAWFGGMHPDVSKTLQILGAVYARQEDNYAALKCFKQCLTIARIQAGGDERDPGVMLALRNIALVQGKDVPRWNDNDQNDSH